jgi:hypothetical protein
MRDCSRFMAWITLSAKMALTAKMRDCSRFMAWITLTAKMAANVCYKKSRTQFLLSETSGPLEISEIISNAQCQCQ